ncbi:MAG TPA: hypothetical protein PKA64_07285, partial [Myxococcota bacterium]|nr:hypothetical protein [Myxococcota bacterium]
MTVYLDWNVCSTWADANPVPTPFSRLWRLTQIGAVAVLFAREQVRLAIDHIFDPRLLPPIIA